MKQYLNKNVLEATQERIFIIFDNFEKIYLSFSGGKDSTVLVHLVMEQAIKYNKKIGLLFIDLEAQYKHTINHVRNIFDMYEKNIIPYWITNKIRWTRPHNW